MRFASTFPLIAAVVVGTASVLANDFVESSSLYSRGDNMELESRHEGYENYVRELSSAFVARNDPPSHHGASHKGAVDGGVRRQRVKKTTPPDVDPNAPIAAQAPLSIAKSTDASVAASGETELQSPSARELEDLESRRKHKKQVKKQGKKNGKKHGKKHGNKHGKKNGKKNGKKYTKKNGKKHPKKNGKKYTKTNGKKWNKNHNKKHDKHRNKHHKRDGMMDIVYPFAREAMILDAREFMALNAQLEARSNFVDHSTVEAREFSDPADLEARRIDDLEELLARFRD